MNVAGIQSALVGFALFDMWEAAISKSHRSHAGAGAGLVAAAGQAFEAYVQAAQIGFASQIAGAAAYALNPNGTSASPVSAKQIAPFLALNILA